MDPKRLAILTVFVFLFIAAYVSADHNITLTKPSDGNNCVLGENVLFEYHIDDDADDCHFYSNESGVFSLSAFIGASTEGYNFFYYNFSEPKTIMWGVECFDTPPVDIDWSVNYSFVLTDAPYCATLTSTSCNPNPSLNEVSVLKTRLGNTKGFWLESQDCNVWVEDSSAVVVKKFNSMAYSQQTGEIVDDEGNDINVVTDKDFITTDSQGWYVYPFMVDEEWAWVGDEYTVYAVCNGQKVSCVFNVSKSRMIDTENYRLIGKEAGGLIVFSLITVVFAAKFGGVIIAKLKRG